MATRRILVTGGAGFIGSHLVDALARRGHEVTVFDSMDPQAHPPGAPVHRNPRARYIVGDVRDRTALAAAIRDQEVVFHQAAQVGVGQSMYQVERYVDHCTMGTARLLDLLATTNHSVRRLLVAGSMSSYGEGLYRCPDHGEVSPSPRSAAALGAGRWEQTCPECGQPVRPVPTPETKARDGQSVYALAKRDQEDYAHLVGRAYGIPTVALRYFNVYGPRQSLSNPYTGVCAIFLSRLRNGNAPVVYEDGAQSRDFVHVHDIVQANLRAMESAAADYHSYNVGSGNPVTILGVAQALARVVGSPVEPRVTGEYRQGDVRHCVADIGAARRDLGYEPGMGLEEGLRELVAVTAGERAQDRFDEAAGELAAHGLVSRR